MTTYPCKSCGGGDATQFFSLPKIPVDCGTLQATRDAALTATVGAIDLCFCNSCGLVFNRSYDPSLIAFGSDYQVSLNCSPTFDQFQKETVERLASKYSLQDKTVFEVGCGNGEFLQTLCSIAQCNGIGIDPTVKLENQKIGDHDARFEKRFFDQTYDGPIGDFVCCLSVFEDIKAPFQFLSELRSRIGDNEIPVYLEVFNGMRALANNEVWSIHYEQCNYFSADSLRHAVIHGGFEVVDSGCCYQGDQYLYSELIPGRQSGDKACADSVAALRDIASGFEESFLARKAEWESNLDEQESGSVVFWGSGGKAITFLNTVSNSAKIEWVVDNNVDRQGKFVPGTGHPVVSPSRLAELNPKTVVISNEIYREEISSQINAMGISPEIEVA